jgi:hypothetical protein
MAMMSRIIVGSPPLVLSGCIKRCTQLATEFPDLVLRDQNPSVSELTIVPRVASP